MTRDLCKPCAEARRERFERLRVIGTGKDRKITCADCCRRRYGCVYEIEEPAEERRTYENGYR